MHYEEVTLLGTYHHAPRYLARALDVLAAGEHPWAALLGAGDHLDQLPDALAGATTAGSTRLAVESPERRRPRVGEQRVPLAVVERLRPVALALDGAEEPERLLAAR